MACSACIFIDPRTTCPGIALSTLTGAPPYQSLIRKMSYIFVHEPFLWRHFSVRSPSPKLVFVCVKLTKVNQHSPQTHFLKVNKKRNKAKPVGKTQQIGVLTLKHEHLSVFPSIPQFTEKTNSSQLPCSPHKPCCGTSMPTHIHTNVQEINKY